MALVLNEDQRLLQRTARDFVAGRSPVAAFREQREAVAGDGFDRALWKEMAELGWASLTLPESLGGLDLGYAELGIVMEELGRGLVASPILSSIVLGATALLEAGDDSQRALLQAVGEGEHLLALAYQEGPRHDATRCATRATSVLGGGYSLRGEKHFVLDGASADTLLVLARTSGEDTDSTGLTLFMLKGSTAGLRREPLGMVDGRACAHLYMDDIVVPEAAVVGPIGGAADILDRVFDRAATALSAEMLGSASAAFEITVEYLKTRKQFGVVIGSFQALKHRAADVFAELELGRSAVMDALRAIDAGAGADAGTGAGADVSQAASIAKARMSDVMEQATAEGIQMHGGIGVTDEADIGLYYKRARTAGLLFGDGDYHRDRFARLAGY